jgi:hypothetical protein
MSRVDPPEWLARAVFVEGVTVDIGFVVSTDLYYGPPNFVNGDTWRTMRAPLRQPAVPLHGRYALVADVAAAPEELIAHFRDVFRQASEHRVDLRPRHPAFWLRPVVFKEDVCSIDFAWYDTLAEARRFLIELLSLADGNLFDDVHQHWGVQVWGEGGTLCLRCYDFDNDEDYPKAVIRTPRAPVQRQIPSVLARGEALVQTLRDHFGREYWL